MMEAKDAVKGHMFVVYDEDCKTPIAKGWIMDANIEENTITATCSDNGGAKQFFKSTVTVVTGHVTQYPLPKQDGILTYSYQTFWDWISGNKTVYTPIR